MRRTVTIRLEGELLERAEKMAEKYDVSINKILKDTIENFLPTTDVPGAFLNDVGLSHILKRDIPIRAILPFTSSMLRYNMVTDFTINIKGKDAVINPFPERSMLCTIKIIERLYQTIKVNENE